MENTFRVQLSYVYYKYLNVLYDVAVNFFAKLTGNVKRLIFVSEVHYHNITMFAFLRATQKLGLMAGPEVRLSVRMLSRTAPAGNEAMPLPTHNKVEEISIIGRLSLLCSMY